MRKEMCTARAGQGRGQGGRRRKGQSRSGKKAQKRGAIEGEQTSLLGLCLFVLLSVCVFIFRVLSLFPTTSHEASCCQEPSRIPVARVLHKPRHCREKGRETTLCFSSCLSSPVCSSVPRQQDRMLSTFPYLVYLAQGKTEVPAGCRGSPIPRSWACPEAKLQDSLSPKPTTSPCNSPLSLQSTKRNSAAQCFTSVSMWVIKRTSLFRSEFPTSGRFLTSRSGGSTYKATARGEQWGWNSKSRSDRGKCMCVLQIS